MLDSSSEKLVRVVEMTIFLSIWQAVKRYLPGTRTCTVLVLRTRNCYSAFTSENKSKFTEVPRFLAFTKEIENVKGHYCSVHYY